MSKILTKTVKKTAILSIVLAVIIVAAVALGIVFGVKGNGVFNKSALLSDSKTLTVSLNQHAYLTKLEDVEAECEKAFANLDVEYQMKGEMSGDESEIVYVFASEADLTAAKTAIEEKFDSLTANEWKGTFITVSANSEKAVKVLVKNYVLRGVIAGVVMAVLVFAYVAIRYRLNMGIVAAIATLLGGLLTAAVIIITRIPVTASVTYVLAVAQLFSAVTTLLTFNKVRANSAKEDASTQSAEELITSSVATKEILSLATVGGVSLIVVGACATAGVRWFAILALIGLVVATFIGLVYAPSLYIPFKKAADKKPVKDAYVGAKKTTTKVKKAKKEVVKAVEATPVKEAPAEEPAVEETVEEAPTEEPAIEETVEEAPAEEPAVEETVEETPAEEPAVEETVEEAPAEEPVIEETVEEAPAEEPAVEETVEEASAEAEENA